MFAKYGMPDVEVQKQASWGTTRDNLVLGSEGNGIDGAHILTPMPYLISAGKVTQNNQPTPMYILARLNLNGQCISVAKEYADLKIGVDTAPFKVALEKKKASGKAIKAAMTFPGGTHDLWIRYWLAAGGIDPDKDIETIVVPPPQMVANMKVGTMDCFCVVRAVEPAVDPSGHRLHRDHDRRTLGQASGEILRHARGLGRQISEGGEGDADGRDGSPAMGREGGEREESSRTICAKRQWINCPVDDVTDRIEGQVRLRHSRQGRRELAAHHALLARPRVLSVPEPRSLVHHRGHPLGQI